MQKTREDKKTKEDKKPKPEPAPLLTSKKLEPKLTKLPFSKSGSSGVANGDAQKVLCTLPSARDLTELYSARDKEKAPCRHRSRVSV